MQGIGGKLASGRLAYVLKSTIYNIQGNGQCQKRDGGEGRGGGKPVLVHPDPEGSSCPFLNHLQVLEDRSRGQGSAEER